MAMHVILGVVVLLLLGWGFSRPLRMRGPGPVSHWYRVKWDDNGIYLDVRSKEPWTAEIPWADIERVMLKMEGDPWLSDGMYFFVKGRENSYAVPTEAENGNALLMELPKRGYFTYRLLVEAAGTLDGLWDSNKEEREPPAMDSQL